MVAGSSRSSAALGQSSSPAERAARGRALRKQAPRSSHGDLRLPADRADPVELLERQAPTRVPELVPIRYGRMLVSPFTFYRGAALIMAADLARSTPRSGLGVQCCGDAHLSNFGVFASPERRLVFDINDFDETLAGPWEWDVKRLAASMMIAAQDRGFSSADCEQTVLETVREYRTAMIGFAAMNNLDVWYAHLDVDETMRLIGGQLTPKGRKRTAKALAKARTRDSMSAFSKLTRIVDGEPRFVPDPPLIVPIADLQDEGHGQTFEGLGEHLRSYRASLPQERRVLLEQFRLTDFARKVVGVGSVGTRAWIALLFGADRRDPLLLQMKEAERSVFEQFLPRSRFANCGRRVVTGQRLMQASSDIFLGWLRLDAGVDGHARDFYVRQLKDWKGSAEIEQMAPKGMVTYGRMCGWTLARAHARSGDRVAIAAYLGRGASFERALVQFSHAYAEQNRRDYEALSAAVASGRVVAETGL
ncbi:MAG TPA: DUF2252 domain-containing protein [Solirubrobacteraceae bacterium]|nr:DUF2252 domain-containing protein [Solirubrobacteraceae bacterium]